MIHNMGGGGMDSVKSELDGNRFTIQHEGFHSSYLVHPDVQLEIEDSTVAQSPLCPAPICRQFWKAGNYDDEFTSKSRVQNSNNYLHVHPKFLHSNATSHKWAFGALAELLDNAIDEIQNGASFVLVDKISNPRDESPCLLIQDDGGGMDPEAIRRCMSFGFSDKKSKTAIGRYGNGFKTSTMRLGADVIVFTCHVKNGKLTQCIGLLSYTYLSREGLDRIVVPMVDYEYDDSTNMFVPLHHYHGEHFQTNKSIILHWSPYCKEVDLKKQFDDIGSHGTKVVVFNLWFTDDETLEFDFESDHEDICLKRSGKKIHAKSLIVEDHIGRRYHYSLRVYLSILYMRKPQNFNIFLRGRIVDHHNVAHDLKYPEFILYRPHTRGTKEEILTTIGFLKEAPDVNIHGFCVYHKNRLILPFWQVVSYDRSRGRGVVGVLEANFIEPIHNKQDFEKTMLFQKLEARLKEMTWAYWDYHCGLIGYQVNKRIKAPLDSSNVCLNNTRLEPSHTGRSFEFGRVPSHQAVSHVPATSEVHNDKRNIQLHGIKRARADRLFDLGNSRNTTSIGNFMHFQSNSQAAKLTNTKGVIVMKQENKKLLAKCLEYEKIEEDLNHKVSSLGMELQQKQNEYDRMLSELRLLEAAKPERDIQNGATFVMVDKISDSRDGSPALLIQDDGGGMDPEAIWRCMSFGFSHKTSEKTIGQYGNGFKTSTMRLGSDAIVFSRQMNSGKLTQSIGLLSYTYLCRKGMNRIVIPMIHYEYNMSNATWEPLYRDDRESFHPNISILLQWSPYSTEAELLKQLDDIGSHGTKVIIYNLWYADERALELDFSTDPEDIRLQGPITLHKCSKSLTTEEHIATQYHYSLRVYMSILYLRLPHNFSMFLRGKVVEHHRIACDLKFPEFIVYKPHTRKFKEEKDNIITMIGFLKEAPSVDINGFNVYHKNRLILPFWKVVSGNRSRGIVGVLEANFSVPIHNKQDFERTPLFERLERRLKIMTWEYWDCHCGLIGYQLSRKPPRSSLSSPSGFMFEPVNLDRSSMSDPVAVADPVTSSLVEGQQLDPTRTEDSIMSGLTKRRHIRLVTSGANEQTIQEFVMMMQENEKLEEKCMEYTKTENELIQKVSLLEEELEEERNKYGRMLSELQELGFVAIL